MRMAGQRIVARLRERTYAAALGQEVEFVERGEGDVLSRLSVDSSIVGERYDSITTGGPRSPTSVSVTQNLSDGLRAVVMASAGRKQLHFRASLATHFLSSWRNVLCFSRPHYPDARTCSPRLVGRCTLPPPQFPRPSLTSTRCSMVVTSKDCQTKLRKPSGK